MFKSSQMRLLDHLQEEGGILHFSDKADNFATAVVIDNVKIIYGTSV